MKIKINNNFLELNNSPYLSNNFLVFIGENGAGKTRLLEKIAYHSKKQSGILFFDENGMQISPNILFIETKTGSVNNYSKNDKFTSDGLKLFKKSPIAKQFDLDDINYVDVKFSNYMNNPAFTRNGISYLHHYYRKFKRGRITPQMSMISYLSFNMLENNLITNEEYNLIYNDANKNFKNEDTFYNSFWELMRMDVNYLEKFLLNYSEKLNILRRKSIAFNDALRLANYLSNPRVDYKLMSDEKLMSAMNFGNDFGFWTMMNKKDKYSSGQYRMLTICLLVTSFLSKDISKNKLVIIDEIDLHFHPHWLVTIIKTLDELFRDNKVSFILSTHNTLVLSGLYSNQVRILKSGKISSPEFEIFAKSNDYILMNLFGLSTPFSDVLNVHQQKLFKEIEKELQDAEII